MNNYQILDWDTKVLGIKTAKILPLTLSLEKLNQILLQLKQLEVKLVYWLTDRLDTPSQQAAKVCHGWLVDEKITYLIDLKMIDPVYLSEVGVEAYPTAEPDSQLEMLAIEIGSRARFAADPHITREQMENVYKTWMRNAAKKEIAQEVLIIKQNNKIVGVVTIADKNNRGDLSLVAVDPNYRGLQLGERLVRAAQSWSIRHGYLHSQVVTQKNNIAACKLYEKCGYHLEKIENFYHFWL